VKPQHAPLPEEKTASDLPWNDPRPGDKQAEKPVPPSREPGDDAENDDINF
jgi:hypothetical protein